MGLEQVGTTAAAAVDYDRYRLRRFVEELDARRDRAARRPEQARPKSPPRSKAIPRRCCSSNAGGHPLVGNALASRTRFAKAFGTTPQKLLPEILRRLRSKPEFVEVTPQGSAGAAGGDDRRRHRPHQAAGASPARQGRRPLHLRRHGFRPRSRDRPDQCRPAPLHGARARHHRHRPRRAERPAQHLSRDARARRAAADERRGRRPSGRLFRRHHAHAGRRDGTARLAARRADAAGEEHHQRSARARRRRMGDRRLSRRGRLQGAGRALRRIPRLLRRREDQPDLPRHRHHAARATRCSRR